MREHVTEQILRGPDGLRCGWSLVAYLALFVLFASAMSFCEKFLPFLEPWLELFRELGALLSAFGAALIMARIERRQWRAYGLPVSSVSLKPFGIGSIWGFLAITMLLVMLHLLRAFDFGTVALRKWRIIEFGVFWALVFLLVGLFEEFLFRGYTQFTLTRGIGFWPAAILLSCVFGGLHLRNSGEAWTGASAGVMMMGLFFCLTLRRTGSLWFAVGFHAAWDWGESFFFSVPDSGEIPVGHLLSSSLDGPRWLTGGTVGPEGSVLCLAVIAVLFVAFWLSYSNKRFANCEIDDLPT